MKHIRPLVLLFITIFVGIANGQHHDPSGKAAAGPVDLGEISFPTSGSAESQNHFIRGVLLLHSFEYGSARSAFGDAIRVAPDFAMAYWGEAMTYDHRIWGEQDQKSALASLARLGPTPAERRAKAPTERERLYMDAVEKLYGDGDERQVAEAYSNAMAELTRRFPDDLEARSFYALSVLGLTGTIRNTENYMRAASIAETIYEKNPKHPGALHYLIHSYDDPVHAPLGLRAARLYGSVAKSASHAQHMPSHIFFALGMWEDAIASNTASMKTARDAGTGGYHPLHWLEHAYLQLGRNDDAAKLVTIVEEDLRRTPSAYAKTHLAMTRATYLVETRGGGAVAVMEPVDADGIISRSVFAGHDMAIGLEYAGRKDLNSARRTLVSLRSKISSMKEAVSNKTPNPTRYSVVSQGDVDTVNVMESILEAAIEFASGDRESAIRKATAAGEAEDKLVFEYGPPAIVKPAWETVGEMLLSAGRKKEAAEAFQKVLKRYPNRRLSNEGLQIATK